MIAAPCANERIRAARLRMPVISLILAACFLLAGAQTSTAKEARAQDAGGKKDRGELSWEMPGRVSIYDLQLGPAVLKDNQWQFMGNNRTLNAGLYGERLTLMVRFSYNGSGADVPLKFVIRLPGSRQYRGNRAPCQPPRELLLSVHHPSSRRFCRERFGLSLLRLQHS